MEFYNKIIINVDHIFIIDIHHAPLTAPESVNEHLEVHSSLPDY